MIVEKTHKRHNRFDYIYIVIRFVTAPAFSIYIPRAGNLNREIPGWIVSCEINCPNIENTFTVITRDVVTYT